MSKPTFKMTGKKALDELLKQINDSKNIDIKLKSNNGNTVLIYAANNGYTDICKILLDNGANINLQNNDGETALMSACRYNNNVEICKFLIENGADINIKDKYGDTAIDTMKNEGIYKQVESYKIIGGRYFKEIFKEYAEAYLDVFETTLYSQDLELDEIKANIDMFYSNIVARMNTNVINEDMEL